MNIPQHREKNKKLTCFHLLAQCPIQPGGNFTYRFNVGEQYGTYWWHAHFQSQRGDGLFGGIIIHEPRTAGISTGDLSVGYEKDVMLMVGDWFHRPAEDVLKWYVSPGAFGNEPVPDSLLINGMGRFDCDMAVVARPVECEQVVEGAMGDILSGRVPTRLRLINVGTIAGFSISVTGAALQAVSVDGSSPIVADAALSIGIVYPGERVDAVLHWLNPVTAESRLQITLDPEYESHLNHAGLV
jgi:FtsP/CotA-like multicopper oxidase with cupredoxin domain